MLELSGTEALTLEIRGSIAGDEAHRRAGAGLEAEIDEGGRGVVELLIFSMVGLGARGLPGPRFSYGEALWRLGVRRAGEPAWLGLACDIDHPWVRRAGALLMRYPVRGASFAFTVDDERWTAEVRGAQGSLVVTAELGAEVAPILGPRPLYVVDRGGVHRVPWSEEPAPFRRFAAARTSGSLDLATLGTTVEWTPRVMALRGRGHRCGFASQAR